MRIADLPNPSLDAVTWITSVEPWQREGLLRIRELLGIDADAVLRAGLTLVLTIVGEGTPDAEVPTADAEGTSQPIRQDQVIAIVPGEGPQPKPDGDGAST